MSDPPQPPQDRFQVFNEGLLFCAIKLLLKDLNMDVEGGGSDDLDRDIDLDSIDTGNNHRKQIKDPEKVLEYWNSCFEKDTLTSLHFREWWRQRVPKFFSPIPSMNYQKPNDHIEEDDVQKYFFDVLEKFICGDDPKETFKKLSSLNSPQTTCGKVFKVGEPTYSCRDCGLDPTCVLCVDCFKNSGHKNCRYKMSTSIGGGYCDCGDPEAWKENAHCSLHMPAPDAASVDPLANVPLDIQNRARQVFSAVLKYSYELLTLDTFMKLPGDLQYKSGENIDLMDDLLEVEDMYATVLFNDEVHTFDEVIMTLTKALDDCDRTKAINYVSLIDKEGRALVKCSQFQACNEVKRVVERITGRRGIKALKVMVIHSHVVAHQVFAIRLVTWLDSVLSHSEGFRCLFSRILTEQEVGTNGRKQPSLLEGILKHDTDLWKAARSAVHHLLISGMLLEHVSKRDFATAFTNSYDTLMKHFIIDDHDHSFSITSLSVQLFTVPTLAHYLVAHQDVLAILLRTFMSECERKRNSKGKLEFERNIGIQAFKRSNYILIDLKYILSIPPPNIDDNTRRGFLHGFSMLLDILAWMQGMDTHTRQINQHIEYEADWENGFNLHMKLAPIIQLLLNWCARDKVIFIKSYRMLLNKIQEELGKEGFNIHNVELAGVSRDCINYNVATEPISLHLPLVRLLTAMSLFLDNFSLSYKSDDFKLMDDDMPGLGSLLELPLRTSVLVSQVHAGMWRRNGYSLAHQIYFYHNARFRGEMYDRDVQTMQFCAANMDQDHFILQLLDKFGISHWAAEEFQVGEEESIRHLVVLVEEFFGLLITLMGERFTPGVGDVSAEDMVRKEIVQYLCVEPMSHSSLNKALPEDVNHETGLEKVIDRVATFKKPTGGASKGVYELKDKCYEEFNVFFYHYTREDQSKSEETQRSRLKSANKPQVCPPPKMPALCRNFSKLSFILQSDLMLYLLNLVLKRADDLKSRCFSESQVHKVLYLIGIGLLEEERLLALDPESEFTFSKRAEEVGMLQSLETLTGSYRIESHKELLAWTISLFKKARGLEEKMDVVEDKEEEDEEARKMKAKAAAERRKKILAQMASQQKNFMKENSNLFEETGRDRLVSTTEWEEQDTEDPSYPVCLGPNRSQATATETDFTCILCQDEEKLAADCNTLVICAFVQKSTVLSKVRGRPLETPTSSTFPFLSAALTSAPHTSSCGHVMHATCWQKYFDDVSESERRRYRTRHPTSFDVEKSEFLCPLCRSLSNTVIPLIPQYHLLQLPGATKMNTEEAAMETSDNNNTEAMEVMEENRDLVEMVVDNSISSDVMEADSSEDNMVDASETVGEVTEARASPVTTDNLDTAVSTSVTVVNSPEASGGREVTPLSPASSHSSSSTELASAHSSYSETFLSASESPKVEPREMKEKSASPEKPLSLTIRAAVTIDFSQWLEALLISLKYRRGLSPDKVSPPPNGGESQPQSEGTETPGPVSNLTRYYTCPLDQVVEELNQKHLDGTNFSKLYLVDDGCELVFRSKLYEIMNGFSQTTYRVGLDGLPHLQDERIPLMVWQSCSFTVHSIVVSLMDADKPVFGHLSSRHNDCLSAFIRFCGVVGSNFGEPKVIRSHGLKLLSTMLETEDSNPSILELDMFGLLVSLTYSLPSLFNGEGPAPLPSCNIQDSHILRLMFLGHITQILFSLSNNWPDVPEEDFHHCPPAKECAPLLDLVDLINATRRQGVKEENEKPLNTLAMWQVIMEQSLGFLRCSALFYHYLSGVAYPSELTSLLPPDLEFINLCKYLSLPFSPKHLLDSPFTLALVRKWAAHANVPDLLEDPASLQFRTSVPKLIDIPTEYSELMNSITHFSCPRSVGEETRMPSPCMCLVCGKVVCSQSFCCQTELDGQSVGACAAHTLTCGAGTGVFLKVKKCQIAMFSGRSKGCYVSPPYLDQYGETDQELRRGNPLTLCKERYAKLSKLWLNHGVPEEVTHSLEQSPGLMTTDWNAL